MTKKTQKPPEVESHVRKRRQLLGLSQKQLAELVGVTRQFICAVEAGQYSPATSVSLRLAAVLNSRVEDLFRLKTSNEVLDGELVGSMHPSAPGTRVKIVRVGEHVMVRPLLGSGAFSSLSQSADGLIIGCGSQGAVKVRLLKDWQSINRQVALAGCDPAIALAADYLNRSGGGSLFAFVLGSGAAIDALNRGEIHVAGVHLVDEESGECNLPYLRQHLTGPEHLVVTFAEWEEGLLVAADNPKAVRSISDLVRANVRFINREPGSGARRLLDRQLAAHGILSSQVHGYDHAVRSHLESAWTVNAGLADVGIGVQTAALAFGLGFIPLQRERYDLVIPRLHYETHPGVKALLDILFSDSFRTEIEALGGYDTRASGKMWDLDAA
jgi:putative molybdopterin biosynthesis protein